jgi:hypothetical protein
MMRATSSQRGQAMVEMALGTTLFVTIVAFGIHFSEISFFELKSQEAANAALFDSTSGKMHDWPTNSGAAATTVNNAVNGPTGVQTRYQDFNGVTAINNPPRIDQVFTYGKNMNVQCNVGGNAYSWGPSNWYTNAVFDDNGGLKCSAQADVYVSAAMPLQFLDRSTPGGLFDQQEYAAPGVIRACGMGRNVNGNCPGTYRMLLDDWGFAGLNSNESKTCPGLPYGVPCAGFNTPYWQSTAIVYGESLMGIFASADAFAWVLVGADPLMMPGIGEMQFYFSFEGENTLFMQPVVALPPEGLPAWETTPFSPLNPTDVPYTVAYGTSSGCYLGHASNSLFP